MSVAQEVADIVDYRRSPNGETRCASRESDCSGAPSLRIGVAVPGFPVVFTDWCAGHGCDLDLDAIQSGLPEGSRVSSRVAVPVRVSL